MKKTIVFGALGLAGCGLVVADLSADTPSGQMTASASNDIINDLIEAASLVRNDPTQVGTLARLGYLLQENGRIDEGMRWLDHARRLDPSYFENESSVGVGDATTQRGGSIQDVWVCTLPQTAGWGAVGGIRAYSIATTSANAGNAILTWDPGSIRHPVISQNLFRLANGRFEQIGMSWLKHGFCALQNFGCGNCMSAGGGCPPRLGPGCADPYDAGLNGTQSRLGPRWQVNPVSGVFTLPHQTPGSGTLPGRLQVAEANINPSLNPGALYFIEGQYIHWEDAEDLVAMNNATWRRVTFTQNATFTMNLTANAGPQEPAIFAWGDFDTGVQYTTVDVPETVTTAPPGFVIVNPNRMGRYHVAAKVSDNGNGTWHYEYAVHNMNSDRAAGSFSIPVPSGAIVTNIGFNDVDYHSGDGIGGVTQSGADWTANIAGGHITWSTTPHGTNPNANALRWATMYNFRFDANVPPAEVTGTLGLFKPGTPTAVGFTVQGPGAPACPADLDGDGAVGSSDLAILLGSWGTPGADLDGDSNTGSSDLAQLLGAWGDCP